MEMGLPEMKFWNVSELVEKLFLLLNPTPALHLDHPHLVNRQSLSSKSWRNLVKQSSYGGEQLKEVKEKQRKGVKALVAILKLMRTGLRMRAKMGPKVKLRIGMDKEHFLYPPSHCKL